MAKFGIAIVVASVLAAGLVWVYPPARLFAEKAVGRGTGCPMEQALKAAGNLREQIRNKDLILNASKLVEKDPAGYHLFEDPARPLGIRRATITCCLSTWPRSPATSTARASSR